MNRQSLVAAIAGAILALALLFGGRFLADHVRWVSPDKPAPSPVPAPVEPVKPQPKPKPPFPSTSNPRFEPGPPGGSIARA